MTIMPIINSTHSALKQPAVIPQAGSKRASQKDSVAFGNGGHGGSEGNGESSHWFLKTLLVLAGGYAAFRLLRKPVTSIVKNLQKENFTEIFKKAEQRDSVTWHDVEAEIKNIAKKNKDAERGFVYRLNETQIADFDVKAKEGIVLGYRQGDIPIVERAIACDKLDEKFLKKLGKDTYIHFL